MKFLIIFLMLCIHCSLLAQENDGIFVGISGDIQKAASWSKLQVGNLLNEKHRLTETLGGAEVRLGYIADRANRLYLALEIAHQKEGLYYYGSSFEYNYTPYFNRYWSGIIGLGMGYSFAILDKENIVINGENPGNLSFNGLNYTLKTGILFSLTKNIETEFFLKARHILFGVGKGNINLGGIQPLHLDMNKTFTFGSGLGINIKF